MTRYEGKTFTKSAFVIEESYFINCVLRECDLFYSGGDSEWMNTMFENCHWHFRGPALKTIQLAQMLGMLPPPQMAPPPSPQSKSKMN